MISTVLKRHKLVLIVSVKFLLLLFLLLHVQTIHDPKKIILFLIFIGPITRILD